MTLTFATELIVGAIFFAAAIVICALARLPEYHERRRERAERRAARTQAKYEFWHTYDADPDPQD